MPSTAAFPLRAGERNVEEHQIDQTSLHFFQNCGDVFGDQAGIAATAFESHAKEFGDQGVVFHDDDALLFRGVWDRH
jgi:hypothetical protein